MESHGHSRSDARHWNVHRRALEKLRNHPRLKGAVIDLLDRWLRDDSLASSRRWLVEWREMLVSWPFEEMADRVLDPERGQVLRQCSPLGPVLAPRERWAALAEVNSAMERSQRESAAT